MKYQELEAIQNLFSAAKSLHEKMGQIIKYRELYRYGKETEDGRLVVYHDDGFTGEEIEGMSFGEIRFGSRTNLSVGKNGFIRYDKPKEDNSFEPYLKEMFIKWLNIHKDEFFDYMEEELMDRARAYKDEALSELEEIKSKIINEIR